MLTFGALSPVIRGIFLLADLGLLLLLIYETANLVRLKAGAKYLCLTSAVGIYEFVLMQALFAVHTGRLFFCPKMTLVLISAALFWACDLYLIKVILQKKRNTITPMSVKEAMDKLPTGVCFYYPSGLCRLVNERMEEVCRSLTGESLRDGKGFWEMLIKKADPTLYNSEGDESIIIMPDSGRVISFKRNGLYFEKELLYELTASDITDEYRLGLELKEKQKKAEEVNSRLHALGDKITEITREEEVLSSKIRIHDEWGRALLMLRRCVLNPEKERRDEAFRLLDKNMALLESENELFGTESEQKRDDIIHAANALGITVEIMGELPTEPDESAIINHAITVCAANLARHTSGHILLMESQRTKDGYSIKFTNDGEPLETEITEGGGLKNLRRRVEKAGGSMLISEGTDFELIIELKEGENGI